MILLCLLLTLKRPVVSRSPAALSAFISYLRFQNQRFMKKLIFAFMLSLGLAGNASAYVTKADIESMLTAIGTTLENMENFYVNNVNDYYTDGTWKQSYDHYTKENGNMASLTDNGIKLTYRKDGAVNSVFFIPYTTILTIDVGKNYMTISLMQ
jgi:hypothetical protein